MLEEIPYVCLLLINSALICLKEENVGKKQNGIFIVSGDKIQDQIKRVTAIVATHNDDAFIKKIT